MTAPDPPPPQQDPPPRRVLDYHDPRLDIVPTQRATVAHLCMAIIGAGLYMGLAALFWLATLAFAGRPRTPLSLCPFVAAIFCSWRFWAALKVVIDHLRAPRQGS